MTLVAVLLLVCISNLGYDNWGLATTVSTLGIMVLTAAYFWQLNRRFAVFVGILFPALECLISILIITPSDDTGSSNLLYALILTLAIVMVGSACFGWNRRIGVAVGIMLGLILGRTLLLIVPSIPGIYIYPPSKLTLLATVLIPMITGGLIGMDIGAYAESHCKLWRTPWFWAAIALLAITGISLRAYDISSGSYRAYTVEELAEMKNATAIIRKMDSAPTWRERISALENVRHLESAKAEQAIFRRLKDPDPRVRCCAIFYLDYTDQPTIYEKVFLEALYDSDRDVRRQAARKLCSLVSDFEGYTFPGLANALIKALHHKDPAVRYEAAYALIYTKDKRAYNTFVSCLANSEYRDCAISGLGELAKLGNKRALPHLLPLFLADEDTARAAIYTVTDLRDKRALPYFIKVIQDDRHNLWGEAAKGAVRIGGEALVSQALAQHVANKDPQKKYTEAQKDALELLGTYGDESVVPMLRRLAKQDISGDTKFTWAWIAADEIEQRVKMRRSHH